MKEIKASTIKKIVLLLMVMIMLFSALSPVAAQTAPDPAGQTGGTGEPVSDEGGLLERAVSALISVPIVVIDYMLVKGAGFKSIGELVFNKNADGTISELPWNESEIKLIQTWYLTLSTILLPFLLIVIVWHSYRLVVSGVNPAMRAEAMENLYRLIGAVLIISLAPLLVDALFKLVAIMLFGIAQGMESVASKMGMQNLSVDTLYNLKFDNIKITTGSVLGTAIVKVAFLFIFIWFNIVYVIRKISVTVMLCFTPVMAIMWAANKNVNAAAIWAGELASNAFMPVAHALVLCIILGFTDVTNISDGTWFHILIYMYTLIPLSEVLRNSMQGLLTKMSGMDEAATGRGVMAGITGLTGIAGLGRVASATIGKKNVMGGPGGPASGGNSFSPSFIPSPSPMGAASPGGIASSAYANIGGQAVGDQTMNRIGFAPDSTIQTSTPLSGSGIGEGGQDRQSPFQQIRQRLPEYTMRAASITGSAIGSFMGAMSGVVPGGKAIGDVMSTGVENSARFVAMTGIMAGSVYKNKMETGQGLVASAREMVGISEGGMVNTAKAVGRMGYAGLVAAQDRSTGGLAGLSQLGMYQQSQLSQNAPVSEGTERKIGFQYRPPVKGMK